MAVKAARAARVARAEQMAGWVARRAVVAARGWEAVVVDGATEAVASRAARVAEAARAVVRAVRVVRAAPVVMRGM